MMKREDGFTLVEILAVVVLLAVLLSLIWNVVVQNAFQQKRVKEEMQVNDSAKALLNHIGDIVMEQNVPVLDKLESNEYITGTPQTDQDVNYIKFRGGKELTKSGNVVTFDGKDYNYIKSISVTAKDRSLTVTIKGESDKAKVEFSNTFYTRNS